MASLEKQHYLFLSSKDSLSHFPSNTATDFTVELPERLYLPGYWECSLIDIFFGKKLQEDLVIFCDLLQNSYINNSKLPVLRLLQDGFFRQSTSFEQLIKIPVSQSQTQRIRIYIRTPTGEIPSLSSETVRCTVLLKKLA